MRDFRSFMSEKNKGDTAEGVSSRDSGADRVNKSDVRGAYEKYSAMPQDELMGELFKQVREEKRNGTLDTEGINSFYRQVAPMLTPEQRENMKTLIDGIIRN